MSFDPFNDQTPEPEHPKIRAWKAYREDPQVERMEVEILQERELLFVGPARLFVFFLADDHRIVKDDETRWEPELDIWLIDDQRARAKDVENEKLRFSLLLRHALSDVSKRYGDGHFNAVLIGLTREASFSSHREITEVLKHIHEGTSNSGPSLTECQERIRTILTSQARRLLQLYADDQGTVAKDILAGALARYLDDRFSVSNRIMLPQLPQLPQS